MKSIVRRRARCLDVLPKYDIEEAMNMAMFSYKEAKRGLSFVAQHLNIWDKDKQYQKSFFRMVFQLLTIILEQDPSIRLKRQEFLKICLDYFIALNQFYLRFRNSYSPMQIASYSALQAFEDFIQKEYDGSLGRYLNVITFKKEKDIEEDEEQLVPAEIKIVQTGIEGLSEVLF